MYSPIPYTFTFDLRLSQLSERPTIPTAVKDKPSNTSLSNVVYSVSAMKAGHPEMRKLDRAMSVHVVLFHTTSAGG